MFMVANITASIQSEGDRTMQFGRCYEEFEVGALYKHWPGRTITEYDDTVFGMLTMNHNPLHIDANYAENTQHKQRLVAGPLIFSIALGMSVGDVSGKAIANLEFEYVKHLAPTFHGDTIYAETTVLDKKLSTSKSDGGIVTVETLTYNQRGETVLSFKRRVLVPTREPDEARQRVWEEKVAEARKRGTHELWPEGICSPRMLRGCWRAILWCAAQN